MRPLCGDSYTTFVIRFCLTGKYAFDFTKLAAHLIHHVPGSTANSTPSQEYVPGKIMICKLNKKDFIEKDDKSYEQVAGMLNASKNGGWYTDNYKEVGRFRAAGAKDDGSVMAYVQEKMKSPSELVMYADTYVADSDGGDPVQHWNFIPSSPTTEKASVTTIHGNMTVAAFADGRAEALTEGQLKALGFESILDSNLEAVD